MKPNFDREQVSDSFRTRGVAKIYEQGGPQDMSKLEHGGGKGGAKRYLAGIVVLILFIAAGLSWIGYNLFSPQGSFKKDNLTLRITAPTTMASGDSVTYRVEYANTDRNPVTDASLSIEYPAEFTLTESNPSASNDQKNRWNIGVVKGGEEGVIEIKGRLLGEKQAAKIIRAKLTYHPIKYNAEFAIESSFTTTIDSSVLMAEIKGPTQAAEGEKVVYQVQFGNFSNVMNKEQVEIHLTYPQGFVFASATPNPDSGQTIWRASTLLSKLDTATTSGLIEIQGVASTLNTDNQGAIVQIGFMEGEKFRIEQESSLTTAIMKGDLFLGLTINGSSENGMVRLGDVLNYMVSYENKGNVTLSEVAIKAHVKSPVINWGTFKDPQGGQLSADEIIWSSKEIPALKELKSGDKGELHFSVVVHEAGELQNLRLSGALEKNKDIGVESWASTNLSIVPQGGEQKLQAQEVKTGTITHTVVTDLSFTNQVRYFNDDRTSVGMGPLPPKVGETTTYRVFWNLHNTLHDVGGFTLTAKLPGYMKWVGKTNASTGDIAYDEASRTITWRIAKLSSQSENSEGSFDVSLSPRPEDVNKIMVLLNESLLNGKDIVNQGKISLKKDAVTSNLDMDPIARGKGLVAP